MAEALNATLQAQFDAEVEQIARRLTVVGCVLTMCLVPIYVVSDYFLYAGDFLVLAAWRLGCLLLTGVILVAARSRIGPLPPTGLALLLGGEVGFMVSGVAVLLEGYDTPYAIGFVLVVLAMALLFPSGTRDTVLLSGAMLATYAGASLVHGAIHNVSLFLTEVSLFVTAGIVAFVGMRANGNLRMREFRTRQVLEETLRNKSELAAALEQQSARHELLNQEMEDLLYVASHDLRAPLINVQGFTRELQLGLDELRQESPTSPETRAVFSDIEESIQFILTSVARMDSLIGSLLNISRIATRTNPTELVVLGPMVEKIIDSFRYQLDQKQITIVVGNLPVVIGDPLRLNQAFSNLVDNAIKYMGDRVVRRIEIGARAINGTCTCYVRDSGPGIPKAKQEGIFRLFHRLVHNGAVPGEGIGLTLVRKIIEKHGGRIWLEGGPDEGSTFWFTLRPAASPLEGDD